MDICDEYDHPDPELVYLVENSPYEPLSGEEYSAEFRALEDLCNSVLCNFCDCTGSDCGSKETCGHGGNYQVLENHKNNPELVLSKNRGGGDLIYECSPLCGCSRKCTNRLVQFGPRMDLQITTTYQKGRALITTAPIREGAFICEYAGEILSRCEAERRAAMNSRDGKMNYIMCLNESPDLSRSKPGENQGFIQTFIDPSMRGNIGRYLNHSCNPNCETLSVRVDSPIPKIGIFAKRDIAALEELCFHYGPGGFSKLDGEKPCHCGAKNCQQFLPAISF